KPTALQTHIPAQQPAQKLIQPAVPGINTLKPLKAPHPPATSNLTSRVDPTIANVFATPLADGPVIFSGPYDKLNDSPAKTPSSSSPHSSSPSSKKNSSLRGNSSLALSSSSPLPDIPWDDDDLMMYFQDPPEKLLRASLCLTHIQARGKDR
ncbi:hypothetical protein RRG08_060333, partial [Elysia crispata]